MLLSKEQQGEIKKIGWQPCEFWAGWDWDFKGNPLDTINKVKTLPSADGYDFLIVGFKKSYTEET